MIDGLHDAHRHVTAGVDEGLFAECLGEGVGVRPTDTGGPGASGIDELIADPAFAQLLRLGSERRCPGSPELAAGLGTELRQSIRQPARRLAVAPHPARRGDFVAPAQPEVERAFRHQLLGGLAAAIAGDVARRNGDEVRRRPEFAEQRGDASSARGG